MQKQTNQKPIVHSLAKLAGAALLVGELMTMAPKANAQLSARAQGVVSSYSGGSQTNIALGGSLSSSIVKPVEATLSGSASFDGRLIKLETAELDISAGPVLVYVYKDPFYAVKQGVGFMGFIGSAVIGAEKSDGGVTTGYVKYKIGGADAYVRPALAAVAWDGSVQKLNIELKMGATISGVPFYTRMAEGILLQDGTKSIKVQVGVDCPL